MSDYKQALLFTQYSRWDDLLVLMVKTKDNFLSKKIEHFLHAYKFKYDYKIMEKYLINLLDYIDYADNELFGGSAFQTNG